MGKALSDDEIKKAFARCCSSAIASCDKCPYKTSAYTCDMKDLHNDVLDLLNRQKHSKEVLEKELKDVREEKSLIMKALRKVGDWIVKKSSADICQLCAYYDAEAQSNAFEADENEDCCAYHRKHGDIGCRNGIIKKLVKGETWKND